MEDTWEAIPRDRQEAVSKMRSLKALGFVIVGITAGIINVLTRMLLNLWLPYEIAIALAFPVALTFAFVLNREHVFKASSGSGGEQYLKFAIVNLLTLVQVWMVSVGLTRFLFPYIGVTWHPEGVAHLIGVLSPIATSFFAYKNFVFPTATIANKQPS